MARPKKKVSANKVGTAKKPRASTAKMLMLAKPKETSIHSLKASITAD